MIDAQAVMTVFIVYLAGVVIPGPNFIAVAHKAVATTRAQALAMVGGIALVSLFWAFCAIAGLGLLLASLPLAAVVLKVLGAAYLIWFGARLIINARHSVATQASAKAPRRLYSAFAQGVATNLGNPKSIAFFAAVFSAAVPPHVSLATFGAMLAVIAVVSVSWYGTVAMFLSLPGVARRFQRGKTLIDRLCGALIIALGVRQAL